MVSRLVDPARHNERAVDEQHGVVTQRDLSRQIDQTRKIDAESSRTQRIITFETLDYYAFNVAANTDQIMYPFFADTATTMQLSSYIQDIPEQCRICVVRILARGFVTAGTCTPFVEITESGGLVTEHVIDECQLSTTTDTGSKSTRFDWDIAPQVAKTSVFKLYLRTNAAYAPTTLDFQVNITWGYEQWI